MSSGPPGAPVHLELGAALWAFGWCRIGSAGESDLTGRERALLAPTQTSKRRAELVAGRVAAHRALARLDPFGHGDVVAREAGGDAGRPVVLQDDTLKLSISHAADWAVALAGRGADIGIDLERREERSGAFLEEAFAPGELEGMRRPALPGLEPAAAAWALKEAVLKVWGVGLRARLARVRIHPGRAAAHGPGWRASAEVQVGEQPPGLPSPPAAVDCYLQTCGPGLVLAAAVGRPG